MGRCAAEYCKDEITKSNPGRRIPTRDRATFVKWMRKVGRLKTHHDNGLIDNEIKKDHKICTKHFHIKYVRRTNRCVKLTPDAVPMDESEYKAHINQERLTEESEAQQTLVNEMMQLDILQDVTNKPTLRSSRRVKTTIRTEDVPATKKTRHVKTDPIEKELEAKTAALSTAAAKLAEMEHELTQLRIRIVHMEQTRHSEDTKHRTEMKDLEERLI